MPLFRALGTLLHACRPLLHLSCFTASLSFIFVFHSLNGREGVVLKMEERERGRGG